MGQGEEIRDKVTTGNDEFGQTNTQKGERLGGTSIEYIVRKSFEATLNFK